MLIAIRDLVAGGLLLAGLAAVPAFSVPQAKPEKPAPSAPAASAEAHAGGDAEMQRAVAALHKSIEGRENEPSEKVFKNIKNFTGVPAGRLLGAMEKGFSPALGVSCAHCHDPEHWESDAKDEKQAARGMMKMVGGDQREVSQGYARPDERQADGQLHHLPPRPGQARAHLGRERAPLMRYA